METAPSNVTPSIRTPDSLGFTRLTDPPNVAPSTFTFLSRSPSTYDCPETASFCTVDCKSLMPFPYSPPPTFTPATSTAFAHKFIARTSRPTAMLCTALRFSTEFDNESPPSTEIESASESLNTVLLIRRLLPLTETSVDPKNLAAFDVIEPPTTTSRIIVFFSFVYCVSTDPPTLRSPNRDPESAPCAKANIELHRSPVQSDLLI
mmetsp:Transcript_7738/g.16557  ORF Transcript_7738/g.16557 Transcript_7738/m.16557 type:complete len:206 (-) Transcript_7738:261-878(-)